MSPSSCDQESDCPLAGLSRKLAHCSVDPLVKVGERAVDAQRVSNSGIGNPEGSLLAFEDFET